jgi:hypothetical protein
MRSGDDPKRCGVRRDRSEQRVLITHRDQVSKAVPAVGKHHRKITHDPARVMPRPPLLEALQTHRQRLR